jgi:hypothetical protein
MTRPRLDALAPGGPEQGPERAGERAAGSDFLEEISICP